MSIYKSYTYLIGWSRYNTYYYGVRHANKVKPEEDLWKIYFTSSKYVKEFRNKHGDPDIIQIRRCFNCDIKAREWEHKVLIKMNVIMREDFLNKSAGKSFPLDIWRGKPKSKSHSRRIGDALRNKPKSEEHKKKLSEKAKGKKQTPEQIANRVLKNTGQKRSKEFCDRMVIQNKTRNDSGWKHSKESIEKIKIAASHRKKYKCINCNIEVGAANYKRWHGDNCRA